MFGSLIAYFGAHSTKRRNNSAHAICRTDRAPLFNPNGQDLPPHHRVVALRAGAIALAYTRTHQCGGAGKMGLRQGCTRWYKNDECLGTLSRSLDTTVC
jgi:hypothetical protein